MSLSWKTVAAIVASGVAGFIAGKYSASSAVERKPITVVTDGTTVVTTIKEPLASTALNLTSPIAAATTPAPGPERQMSHNLLSWLHVNPNVHVVVPVLGAVPGEYKLTDAIASLFELTPSERSQIESRLRKIGNDIERLRAEQATGTPGRDGSWVINVPAFPERGGALYDEMTESISSVLGPERSGAFLEMAGPTFEKQFGSFGAEDGQIVLSRVPIPSSGNVTYRFSESTKSSGTEGNSSGEISQREIETRFGEVVRRQVPAGFWRH